MSALHRTPPATEPRRAVVWGASGHGSVIAEAATASGAYEVVGFLDEVHPERRGEVFVGLPIVGGPEALPELLRSGVSHVLLGVGNNPARLRIASQVEQAGFTLGTVVHPAATVASTALLREGAFVNAGAIVGPEASIGRAAIINTSASVDHHCEIGAGAHVAPGTLLAGGVRVGDLAWVGIGAVVIERRTIGAGAFIGAGALVLRDVPDGEMAYGLPARPQVPSKKEK